MKKITSPSLIRIICDTKEKQPLKWEGYNDLIIWRDSLPAGDYTMSGHDMPGDDYSIIIERKNTCLELVGNLGTHWERFLAEAEELQKYYFRQIVVNHPANFEQLYEQGLTKLRPEFVYRQLSILAVDYGVPTIFLPDRSAAEDYIFRLFVRIQKRIQNEQ